MVAYNSCYSNSIRESLQYHDIQMEKIGPHGCSRQKSVLQLLLLSVLHDKGGLLHPEEHDGHIKLGVFQDI